MQSLSLRNRRWLVATAGWIAILAAGAAATLAGQGGQLRLEVIDRDTKEPIACRMHLTNAAKRPLKAPKVPFFHDHFVFSGSITIKLPEGEYAFEIERGPEYLVRLGHFSMQNFSDDTKVVDLKRFVDMAADGWWSGDLHVERPAKDLELLMQAEDLHVVQLVTWPNRKNLLPKLRAPKSQLVEFDGNRYYHLGAGLDARAGGSLLFFNLDEPLDLGNQKAEFPPQSEAILKAKSHERAWIDAREAYGWDLPLWIAGGQLDSIQIANSNLQRKSSATKEGSGKPRDTRLFPGSSGNGRWSEKIYYHLLDCGLRVVPTAGSGSGTVANPLGYNRLYVHVDGELTYDKWWESLRAGRVTVTNGPLLRPNVEGEMPGHVFRAPAGEQIELEIGLSLSTRDKISYLEIVKNGEIAHQVRLNEWEQTGGKLPLLNFSESGWFLIRAVTDVPETYRYATTAPYYVEIGDRPRVSKSSAQFFLDCVNERASAVAEKLDNPREREAVTKLHDQARSYWQGMVERANAK
jgi:hypothetical protein